MLSFNNSSKDGFLKSHLWIDDKSTEAQLIQSQANSGFSKRKEIIKGGNQFHFISYIHNDIFNLSKNLLPNISITIEFSKASEAFFLLGKKELDVKKYKLVIDDLKIHLKSISVTETLINAHNSALLKSDAIYSILEGQVNFASIPSNMKTVNLAGIQQGILPSLLFVGLLGNTAKSGDIEKNPYSFENHSVESVSFLVNGKCT